MRPAYVAVTAAVMVVVSMGWRASCVHAAYLSAERLVTVRAAQQGVPYVRVPSYASVVSRTIVDGHRTTVLATSATNVKKLLNVSKRGSYEVMVQPNYPYRALFTPNDPLYPFQWHFPSSNVPRAWDFDTTAPLYGGDPSVIVAVLDTGVSYEDYQTYKKAPDFAGANFTTGYDFVNNDDHPNDDNGHGTHVAMTIAESTNNSTAGSGIAYNATVMPVKVLDAEGNGSTATIAAGVDYARLHGARVINLSLGGTENDPVLHAAVQNAVNEGIAVVSATGNDGVGTLYYPAQYDEVIAVGSVRFDENRALYSNYGPGIDLVAPGGQLYIDGHYTTDHGITTSLDQNNDGQPDGVLQQTCVTRACDSFDDFYYEGTSQATPQVSATVALLLSAGIDAARTLSILQSSAKDLGTAGYDTTYGWGMLDVAQALTVGVNDTSAPSGTISLNEGRRYTRIKEIAVAVAASDVGSSVAAMSFSNNGTSFSSWEPFAANKTWDVTEGFGASSGDGAKAVYARFRDAAGNVSAEARADVVLDRVKPATPSFSAHAQPPLDAVTIVSGMPTSLKAPVIEWSSSDAGSGIAGYRIEYTKNSKADFNGGGADVIQTYVMPTFTSSSTAYLRVTALDGAGNQSSVASFIYAYRPSKIVLGVSSSIGSTVILADTGGSVTSRYTPYGRGYRYGINVASAVTEPGTSEIVVVAAQRGKTNIKVLNSRGGTATEFSPYGSAAIGGIFVTPGDTDDNGKSELIVTPIQGRFPLRIFSIDGKKIGEWYPYGKTFSNGFTARLLRSSDGAAIVTAPRNGSTLIRVFSDKGRLNHQWYGFSKQAAFGLHIATGDINADGDDEIAIAPVNGAPQVKVFARSKKLLGQFFAFSKTSRTGAVLAMADVEGHGRDAVIAAPAHGTVQLKCLDVKGKTVKKCKAGSSAPSGDISITDIR